MASNDNLFGLEQTEVDNTNVDTTRIFEKIHKETGEYLTGETDTDSTDGIFDFLESLTNCLQEDFHELIGEDNDKKRFVKTLTRIFALLFNTKVDTADKIKRILKIIVETTLKRTKVTPRRRERRLPTWLLRQNRVRQRTKRTYSYKIKLTLPEQKQVDITKNGAVIKTIRVRRKSKYFNSRSARVF